LGVVEVPVERYFGPAEKLNITLPRLLLAKIDEYARARRNALRFFGRRGADGDALTISRCGFAAYLGVAARPFGILTC
jgi:hypothetical protein